MATERRAGADQRPRLHGQNLGNAIPYGVYDVAADTGWVSVGTDHDTAEFGVATIRTWWHTRGSGAYPTARRLLIVADRGGSKNVFGKRAARLRTDVTHVVNVIARVCV